jgi:hypothetical protein
MVIAHIEQRARNAMLHSAGCRSARRRDRADDGWRHYATLQVARAALRSAGFIVDECFHCSLFMYADAGLIEVEELDATDFLAARGAAPSPRPAPPVAYRSCEKCARVMTLRRRPGRPPKLCPECSGRAVTRLIALTSLEEIVAGWAGETDTP